MNARLLLLSPQESDFHDLSAALDGLGLRTISAHAVDAACSVLSDLAIEAVVVHSLATETWPGLGDTLRQASGSRCVPIIALTDQHFDGCHPLPADAHPQQIALTAEHLIRAAVADEEFNVRKSSFPDLMGAFEALQAHGAPLSVLSIGAAAPQFLSMSHELKAQGMELVAALTSYSAFDYLHDKIFDVVMLWADESPADSLAIASGMRRNTRLFHTPIVLHTKSRETIDSQDAYMRGINDIVYGADNSPEVVARLFRLARVHRRQSNIRKCLESIRQAPGMDSETGLFSRDLFASHLARLSLASAARNRPLSVCLLKLMETPEVSDARQRQKLDRALPQVGSMVSRLIRAEDTGGRLSNEVFALALPSTPHELARHVGERIAAVIGCTAFDSGQGRPPFVVELGVGVAQLRRGEDPASVLLRADADLRDPQASTQAS